MSHIFLSPLTLAVLGGLVLWATWRPLPRVLKALGLLSWLALLALCAPVGANLLVRHVEGSIDSVYRCEAPRGAPVVVLSGGLEREPVAVDDHVALAPETWRRLQAGIRFRRAQGEGPLVLVGGGPYAVKEADVMADLAAAWGMAPGDVRVERWSRDTWENASGYAAMAGPEAGPAWLVTSALHMPRAVTAFRAAGVQVCVHPSHSHYVAPGELGYYIPQVTAIEKSRRALHEWLGQHVYRYRASREGASPAVHAAPGSSSS